MNQVPSKTVGHTEQVGNIELYHLLHVPLKPQPSIFWSLGSTVLFGLGLVLCYNFGGPTMLSLCLIFGLVWIYTLNARFNHRP